MESPRPGNERSPAVFDGRGTAPGHACGPLRRNRPGLNPDDSLGVILVAERAVPEDVGRILAAAGTITFGGAVLSHISLLAREFGKPSVSMAGSRRVALAPGPDGLLELTPAEGAGPVLLYEGDIVFLDGDQGRITVPGAGDPGFRGLLQGLFPALARFGREPQPGRLQALRQAIPDPPDPALVAFLMEAAILYRILPAGAPARQLVDHLERSGSKTSVAGCRERLAARIRARAHRLILEAEGELTGVTEPDDLERRVARVEALSVHCREQLQDLGQDDRDLDDRLAAYQGKAAAVRDGFRFGLTREVEDMLAMPDEALRHRIGGLFQLLRRARTIRLDPELTAPLQDCLSKHLAAERARAGAHLVVPLDAEEGVRDRTLVGGKAAGLIQVRSILPADCRIPWGFVVTTSAYRLHLLGENGERVREALESGDDPAAVSRRAKAAILGSPVPREVGAALQEALSGRESVRLAVRSSGTLEDGPAGSLAGQYDTYLGVRGREELDRRIRMAWASLWNHRAIRMLSARGHKPASAAQAVLVQEMVETRAAGVLFSRDPAGKPDTILVNAAWGLGEGISQGEVEGDLYWVRRSTGELIGSDTCRSGTMIVLDPENTGTVEQETPVDRRSLPCLGPEELARLAELARCLESGTGRGQDVEFGFTESGELVVFQVRRVMDPRSR